jgi:hypothetical protein
MSGSRNYGVHSKMYFPIHLATEKRRGYIIGWNTTSFVACVSTVVCNFSLEDVENSVMFLSEKWKEYSKLYPNLANCSPPSVLGEWIPYNAGTGFTSTDESKKNEEDDKGKESMWMVVELDKEKKGQIVIREINCYGYRYHVSPLIIFYKQPSSMHFYSSTPLSLDLATYNNTMNTPPTELEEALNQVRSAFLTHFIHKLHKCN